MSFILRIYFYGLLALVPSAEDGELTILLVEARQPYALSNGSEMEEHVPMLIARAGACEPIDSCSGEVEELSEIMFPQPTDRIAGSSVGNLQARIAQGGAWVLDQSDVTIRTDRDKSEGTMIPLQLAGRSLAGGRVSDLRIPSGPQEAAAFNWIAAMSELIRESGRAAVDPDVLSPDPQKGLIVGRIRLNQGKVSTYRLVEYEGEVVPLEFRTLARPERSKEAPGVTRRYSKPTRSVPDVSRALAEAMVVEIEIQDDHVTFLDQNFSEDRTREMTLRPEVRDGEKVVEVAILNAPLSTFSLPEANGAGHIHPPEEGAHFEIFYELLEHRPPNHLRPVPVVSKGLRATMPQAVKEKTDLLETLLLGNRGSIARPICPGACFGPC